MDTNSSLSPRLILAPASEPYLDTVSPAWHCSVISPQPRHGFCYHSLVFTLLAHKPSRLAILDPQHNTLPAEQKKTVALRIWAESRNVAERFSALDRIPVSEAALCSNALCGSA